MESAESARICLRVSRARLGHYSIFLSNHFLLFFERFFSYFSSSFFRTLFFYFSSFPILFALIENFTAPFRRCHFAAFPAPSFCSWRPSLLEIHTRSRCNNVLKLFLSSFPLPAVEYFVIHMRWRILFCLVWIVVRSPPPFSKPIFFSFPVLYVPICSSRFPQLHIDSFTLWLLAHSVFIH